MVQRQNWFCRRKGEEQWFNANVPGNVQKDYADFNGWGNINYGKNCDRYIELESSAWIYRTELKIVREQDDQVYFVTDGIDYIYDILLNDELILSHEGMFTRVTLDLTEKLLDSTNVLEVVIHPHPKREGALPDRQEADQCCKPPVSYGWDWHPRVIPSGIWNDAYIETRMKGFIRNCEAFYELSDDYTSARVHFEIDCDVPYEIQISDMGGKTIYTGREVDLKLDDIKLWWCNGQGEPYLYNWSVTTCDHTLTGCFGFRRVELVMNHTAWDEPTKFPKSRSCAPATIRLNGRNIFAKGSNWVNPEIFTGTITKDTYERLLKLAKESNMNILRCWGGAGCNKESFYHLCDLLGIMVWQEFPLACNNYEGTAHYLRILEQEGRAIVRRLRYHPSVVLWCGGNELFNSWSKMTDQSLALRLLNKICYEEVRNTPFIATSPIMGMGHGGYLFYTKEEDEEVYRQFNNSKCTAYTEFGVPGISNPDYLKTFIPKQELFPPKRNTSWHTHHAFGAWTDSTWLCEDVLQKYFGKIETLEKMYEYSSWLQCEGYKAIYEEARRQKPCCSMALSWCFNEPWMTAANNSIINYPAKPKPAYYAVKDSLRDVMASARVDKFSYDEGELFGAELWLLNDSPFEVIDVIQAYIELGGREYFVIEWKTPIAAPNSNICGHKLQFKLPDSDVDRFTLILKTTKYGQSSYTFGYQKNKHFKESRALNV